MPKTVLAPHRVTVRKVLNEAARRREALVDLLGPDDELEKELPDSPESVGAAGYSQPKARSQARAPFSNVATRAILSGESVVVPTLECARDEHWVFAREMADVVAAKTAEVMRIILSGEERHNLAHAIYVELCHAQNDRD
jgi:hypothetical protein